MAIDPVCKMKVDPKTAVADAEYEGQKVYFCAPGCKRAFERDPERYLKGTTDEEEHSHHCED